MVEETKPAKYYEDFLAKKEGKNKWAQYWVIIRGTWMLFYEDKYSRDRNKLRGSIELIPEAKCKAGKRRTYSFPFYITSKRGSHLFKCETNLKRHQWIYVIGLAIKHSPPVPPPSFVPLASSVVIDNDGKHLTNWRTSSDRCKSSDDEDDEIKQNSNDDDDDDFSLPPGVIFVTTLPDELAQVDSGPCCESEADDSRKNYVPVNAVLSTGITGATSVIQERSGPQVTTNHRLLPPRLTGVKPVSNSADSIVTPSTPYRGRSPFGSSTSLPGREDNRPSTSPLPSSVRPQLHSKQHRHGLGSNFMFSRHMAASAPDVNALIIRDIS